MRQSLLFTKTYREEPKDEQSRNAALLMKAGFMYKHMAGVYTYLPLGFRVLKKIEQIIREEMNAIGGQEMLMTTLQDKEIWEKTGRWDDAVIDNWFKTTLKNGTELGVANTHEEALTSLMNQYVHSYKDLPVYAYQIQNKFRNELRAKSGIMRCREFIMKDLYSFSRTQAEHDEFYEKAKQAYLKIYQRVGIGDNTFVTFASGGSFSKYSHEFQTLTSAGEDTVYLDRAKQLAVNKEVFVDEVLQELGLEKERLEEVKAVEVGNIFSLGTRFSAPLGLSFASTNGEEQTVIMGCYGIGLGRLMGVIVEVLADDKGIVWPKAVAPYAVHLVSLCKETADVAVADELYQTLTNAGVEVLYDDREARAGEKFADSDLIGIPIRVVISQKTIEKQQVEVKLRTADEPTFVGFSELVAYVQTV